MLYRPSPSNVPHQWTNQDEAKLKQLWADGHSASQIAQMMGMGLTKNSIIGKANRLKLPARTTTMSKSQKSAAARASVDIIRAKRPKGCKGQPKPQAIAALLVDKDIPLEPMPLSEEEMGNDVTPLIGNVLGLNPYTCKWPIGDPLLPGFGFCGRHSDEGSPYCAQHRARAILGLGR